MLPEDVFIEFLSFVEFTHGLVQTGQIVRRGHRNSIVVMLVVFSLSFRSVQGCKEIFLLGRGEGR